MDRAARSICVSLVCILFTVFTKIFEVRLNLQRSHCAAPVPRIIASGVSGILRTATALFALALSVGAGIAAAATHIQQATFNDVSSRTYTSISATLGATASGDAIVIGMTFGNANPLVTATDNHGNTYVQAIKTYDSGHRQGVAILFASSVTGGSTTQVTV